MAKSKQTFLKRSISLTGLQIIIFAIIFAAVGVYALLQSFASPLRNPAGSCSYNSQVVTATGLPNGEVINFLVTDNTTGNRTGWVLGNTNDGTWTVNVPTPKGSTTYDFVSRTYGKNGSKFNIFAECSTVL